MLSIKKILSLSYTKGQDLYACGTTQIDDYSPTCFIYDHICFLYNGRRSRQKILSLRRSFCPLKSIQSATLRYFSTINSSLYKCLHIYLPLIIGFCSIVLKYNPLNYFCQHLRAFFKNFLQVPPVYCDKAQIF